MIKNNRISIMIESKLDIRIRKIQGTRISTTGKSCSYSKILNELLEKALK